MRALIAGNWKMNGTRESSRALAAEVAAGASGLDGVDLAVFPPFPFLADVGEAMGGAAVALGAQDLDTRAGGAFTGAVSGEMLASVGCRYALTGHSERRHVFGDDDAVVAGKLRRALDSGLHPVLCVGETAEEQDAGEGEAVVRRQLEAALADLPATATGLLTVAYEPVWAIGTGRPATPEGAEAMHEMIRADLVGRFGDGEGGSIRILYGGSVNAENAAALLTKPSIDGVLVGGASLKAESFLAIARAGQEA